MSRSMVKVARDKTGKTAASSPLTVHCTACAIRCKFHTAADETVPWPPGDDWEVSAACLWCVFGKTFLALVVSIFTCCVLINTDHSIVCQCI